MQWNTIHKSKHWNADTQAIVTVSQSAIESSIEHTKREKPIKTITVHCTYSEYTPTIFRTIQALAVDNYIYSLQLVTGNINRRAVSPTGLLNQEGVQNAQKAKPSRLEHLPAGLGGGL